MARALVWFRNDLRVHDNPALAAALAEGETSALFLVAVPQWRSHGAGDARLAFLARCLESLGAALSRIGVPLEVHRADLFRDHPAAVLSRMRALGATVLHFNAEYPLDERRRDEATIAAVRGDGREAAVWHGGVLTAPGTVRTAAGGDYTVFTPFRRRFLEQVPPAALDPLPAPRPHRREPPTPPSIAIAGVAPALLAEVWPGGEEAALSRLDRFVGSGALERYAAMRDVPAADGTSRLSPYFAVGALSPRLAFTRVGATHGLSVGSGAAAWQNELLWREFYAHVTAAFPHVSRGHAFRRALDAVRWRDDRAGLEAWKAGRTGYPIVDAGMRELAATGYMHNRVRMVTAMFLAKHLLVDWREGERHFMDRLVDGDFAANNGGWQWSASTGTDAAPYFRIFNPIAQARKFDPDGAYVRRWIPELADADVRDVFEPWRAPALRGRYPAPIVDHASARTRAIAAFKAVAGPVR